MIKNLKVSVIYSEFNFFIVEKLLKGCKKGLKEIACENVEFIKVPGAFEIPLASLKAFDRGADCVIALGCVIEGETAHYEHVCRSCVDGLMRVQLDKGKPIIYEVLMVDDIKLAIERSSDNCEKNKGYIAAMTLAKLFE